MHEWTVYFSDSAEKFLKKHKLPRREVLDLIKRAIQKFRGEQTNINIKKLKGKWSGFYRIRKGDLRIIVEFNFENSSALIEEIDHRGNAYKQKPEPQSQPGQISITTVLNQNAFYNIAWCSQPSLPRTSTKTKKT